MLRAVVAAAVLLLGSVSASAQTADPLYPINSLLEPTQNTVTSASDSTIGFYQFEAGLLGIATRAADRYPKILSAPQTQTQITNEIQATVDSVLHLRPNLPYDPSGGDAGNPYFMPDWNRNGVFGDAGDFDRDTDSDPHAIPGTGADTAFFRYPCANADGSVSYVDAAGECTKNPSSFRVGVARELKVVNARGLVIDATLWLPGHVASSTPLVYPCDGCSPDDSFTAILFQGAASGVKLPGTVFSDGFLSRQEHYYWFAMRMAREGFVVMTYDPAGQGESEGNAIDLLDVPNQNGSSMSADSSSCQFQGACRDLEDMVRWFVGDPVTSVVATLVDKDLRVASRRNSETENAANPTLAILDTTKVGVGGNSMGALSTLHYLLGLGNGAGMDGKPLPSIAAAVVMSGAAPTHIGVPTQFQTSDYDGSPLLVGPSLFGVGLGFGSSGIGYNLIKQGYDKLRDDPTRTGSMELVILEGGVHTDHVSVPYITRTNWATQVASDYGADWLKCYVAGVTEACGSAVAEREHISRAFASEHVAADSDVSQCIRVPDRAILNQPPADFLAAYAENKHVCDCAGETDGRSCDTPPTFSP